LNWTRYRLPIGVENLREGKLEADIGDNVKHLTGEA
jgi:hypothetical protein